ncbi:hypothetical protein PC9H_010062 [Pleurotus ostreatus]|uniref:MFS general substrate transporter n=1 Tax=Pleurotus ostreatus TaxID=5322 RepID=A0A8H7DSN9_PLEOS|nr:uncharacterized protein PC9H_010062 [Pleurotus ostreatus]KAF7424751.1 hypothetical protein PC9H_010062 [Pleurotus ostreatus]
MSNEKETELTVNVEISEDVFSERREGLKEMYYRPLTQVSLLGFVCFMCPGLFNALNGLGAGGQGDSTISANANAAHYATFAFAAFFAGSVNNVLGSKLTLLIGSTGYALYIGSFLAINIHPNAGGFVVASGAILGICAGLLWTAQGSLMLAYPTESQKGRYIGVFWTIFNLGGVVGASIGFLVLTLIGVLIPLLMANPDNMIRTDGTKVTSPRHASWKAGVVGLWLTLRDDPMILLLFPMFFASNWFYTWQFNEYNGTVFNIRARSLNNLVYWMAQIVGSLLMGALLDGHGLRRRVRAFLGWGTLFALVFVVHIWAYFYQRNYTRQSLPPDAVKMDIHDHGFASRIWLYIFCGVLDAMWQTSAYWMMGALSNDPAKLAYVTGFYKSLQSAGAAGVWRADGVKRPFMEIFISTWVLLVVGLMLLLPMIYLRVTDYTKKETLTRTNKDSEDAVRA